MTIFTLREWRQLIPHEYLQRGSVQLATLENRLHQYERAPGNKQRLNHLDAALQTWSRQAPRREVSSLLRSGMPQALDSEITRFRQSHMPFERPGGPPPRDRLLASIPGAAARMASGTLEPRVSVPVPRVLRDRYAPNVSWEGFTSKRHVTEAGAAFDRAQRCASIALQRIDHVDTDPSERARFRQWFGEPTVENVDHVRRGLERMNQAFRHRNITFAYKPLAIARHVPARAPFEAPTVKAHERSVAYVWGHEAGSGVRIVLCGPSFKPGRSPELRAKTIAHEMSHKVLDTKDHAYGPSDCRALTSDPSGLSFDNADSWGFYINSFGADAATSPARKDVLVTAL